MKLIVNPTGIEYRYTGPDSKNGLMTRCGCGRVNYFARGIECRCGKKVTLRGFKLVDKWKDRIIKRYRL